MSSSVTVERIYVLGNQGFPGEISAHAEHTDAYLAGTVVFISGQQFQDDLWLAVCFHRPKLSFPLLRLGVSGRDTKL